MVERQKPTRTETRDIHEDYRETHPAYAMIGASRVTSNPGEELYGSDFKHGHYVTISIVEADLRRSLANDWSAGGKQIIEVALSEAQWATFVSSMNVGFGVQCTIQRRDGAYVPRIEGTANRRDQFNAEVADRLKTATDAIDDLLAGIESGAGKKALRAQAEKARRELGANIGYVAEQFDEHAEKTVEKAKMEVNAYVTAMTMRLGAEALAGGQPLLLLDEPEADADGA